MQPDVYTDWHLWDRFHTIDPEIYKSISKFIYQNLNSTQSNLRNILDLGIGSGIVTVPLVNSLNLWLPGIHLTGIDKNVSKLKLLEQKFPSCNFDYDIIQSELDNEFFPNKLLNKKFDIILCIWFLHYILNIKSLIEQCKTVLKSGGILVYGYSSGDLQLLTGQRSHLDNNDINGNYYLFETVNKLLSHSKKKNRSIYPLSNDFFLVNTATYSWDVELTLEELISVYRQKLIAKDIIDTIDEKHFREFSKELLLRYEKTERFNFTFGLTIEILIDH